jgi:hypothetical protein
MKFVTPTYSYTCSIDTQDLAKLPKDYSRESRRERRP